MSATIGTWLNGQALMHYQAMFEGAVVMLVMTGSLNGEAARSADVLQKIIGVPVEKMRFTMPGCNFKGEHG